MKKKTKKEKVYWVTRDGLGGYSLWSKKPFYVKGDEYWCNHYRLYSLSPNHFESLTDIKLKGGPKSIIKIKGFKVVKG